MAVEFALGIFDKAITLVSFIGILWTVSGALDVTLGRCRSEIPGYMVFAALLYAGIGSILTYFVGRPIVAANMRQNATEADYRFALVRLRENSEAVALIRGEPDEKKVLTNYFGDVAGLDDRADADAAPADVADQLLRHGRHRLPDPGRQPALFRRRDHAGRADADHRRLRPGADLAQLFRRQFPAHRRMALACRAAAGIRGRARLDRRGQSEAGEATTIVLADCATEGGEEGLHFDDLQITHVDGNIVIADANTEIAKGERVLIVGPSGSGKSTLFRAIAGLWPWGAGKIVLPDRSRMMFMPQRPYLPLGTLRAAVVLPGVGAQVFRPPTSRRRCSAAISSI